MLRVRPPGIEWKPGRNPKRGEKKWLKKEKWPTARTWKNEPKPLYFAIFGPSFHHFRLWAIFYFAAIFAPFSGFRPVFQSIPGGLIFEKSWSKRRQAFGSQGAVFFFARRVLRRFLVHSAQIVAQIFRRFFVAVFWCCKKTGVPESRKTGQRLMGETKWEKGVETASCDFLRFPAVSCSFLRLQTTYLADQGPNLQKSAKIFDKLLFLPFSLSHLELPDKICTRSAEKSAVPQRPVPGGVTTPSRLP